MCADLTCTYGKLTSNASSFKICSLNFCTDNMKAFNADDAKEWLQQGTTLLMYAHTILRSDT